MKWFLIKKACSLQVYEGMRVSLVQLFPNIRNCLIVTNLVYCKGKLTINYFS